MISSTAGGGVIERQFISCLELVQLRQARPDMTVKNVDRSVLNQTNLSSVLKVLYYVIFFIFIQNLIMRTFCR